MRNPLRVKKISTPTPPLRGNGAPAWLSKHEADGDRAQAVEAWIVISRCVPTHRAPRFSDTVDGSVAAWRSRSAA
jgi:hypothetical protein